MGHLSCCACASSPRTRENFKQEKGMTRTSDGAALSSKEVIKLPGWRSANRPTGGPRQVPPPCLELGLQLAGAPSWPPRTPWMTMNDKDLSHCPGLAVVSHHLECDPQHQSLGPPAVAHRAEQILTFSTCPSLAILTISSLQKEQWEMGLEQAL